MASTSGRSGVELRRPAIRTVNGVHQRTTLGTRRRSASAGISYCWSPTLPFRPPSSTRSETSRRLGDEVDLDVGAGIDVEAGEGEHALAAGCSTTVAVPVPVWPSAPLNSPRASSTGRVASRGSGGCPRPAPLPLPGAARTLATATSSSTSCVAEARSTSRSRPSPMTIAAKVPSDRQPQGRARAGASSAATPTSANQATTRTIAACGSRRPSAAGPASGSPV